MWKGYFKNLKTGEIFTKECRYSKKIKSLGCVKVWG